MNKSPQQLDEQLCYLKLRFMEQHYRDLAATAAKNNWSPHEYFAQLIHGEAMLRWDNSIQRLISMARFPVVKTLE